MKVVVTGGSGLVGSYLKDVESAYGEHEFVYLNRSKNDQYSIDLTDKEAVDKFFKKNKFDYIIHLAANVGGLFKNLKNNSKIFKDNIIMQENILEACNKYDIQRGIFCLSSCIFPYKPSKFPMSEKMILESEPHFSNRGYAYAKRMLYIQCQNYNKDFNREYICIAPVNMYGKYDNFSLTDGHFIPSVMHRFHLNKNQSQNKEFVAFGTGKPLRQLLYAEDAAKIMLMLLLNKELTKNYDLINITDSSENTIKYFIEKLVESMNIDKSNIKWDTSKSDGCMKKTITNDILKDILPDYKFKTIEEGFKETYEWFVENFDKCRK